MGNKVPEQGDDVLRRRINKAITSLDRMQRDVKYINSCARYFPDAAGNTLYLQVYTSMNENPLLPVLWRVGDVTCVVAFSVPKRDSSTPESSDGKLDVKKSDTVHFDEYRRAYVASLDTKTRPGRRLSIREFYYLYIFVCDNVIAVAKSLQPAHKPDLKANTAVDDDGEKLCSICLDEDYQVALPCTHSFCERCLSEWTAQSSTCPLCRTEIKNSGGGVAEGSAKDLGDSWCFVATASANDVKDMANFPHKFIANKLPFERPADSAEVVVVAAAVVAKKAAPATSTASGKDANGQSRANDARDAKADGGGGGPSDSS